MRFATLNCVYIILEVFLAFLFRLYYTWNTNLSQQERSTLVVLGTFLTLKAGVTMYRSIIGSRIGQLREQNKETQNALSEAIGVNRKTVDNWEQGIREIKAPDIIKLAQHFGVSSDFLLGLSDISSTNASMVSAHRYTGLSEKALEFLNFLCDKDENGIYPAGFTDNDICYPLLVVDTLFQNSDDLFLTLVHISDAISEINSPDVELEDIEKARRSIRSDYRLDITSKRDLGQLRLAYAKDSLSHQIDKLVGDLILKARYKHEQEIVDKAKAEVISKMKANEEKEGSDG